MKKINLPQGVTRALGRGNLVMKKYSPEILLGVGVISIISGTVMACIATLKVESVLDDFAAKKDTINEAASYEMSEYPEADARQDMVIVHVQTAVKLAKLYAPAITLTTVGIACIIGSHGIMRKRNIALVASYTALEKAFDSYRGRVAEKFGEDEEFNIRHNITKEKMTTEEVDENGKVKKVKKDATVINGNSHSPYAKFFDEYNVNWRPNADFNMIFLRQQQQYANDMLLARGHVLLNDVYDDLGLDRTSAGAVVGWALGHGDGYIDFGIYDSVDFVNGREASILLDFNVDGVMYDLIN